MKILQSSVFCFFVCWGVGVGGSWNRTRPGNGRTRFQSILMKFWSYKGSSCSLKFFWVQARGAWMSLIPERISLARPHAQFLNARILQKPPNGAPEMLWNRNWQRFPFKLPNWRKSRGGTGKVNAMCHLGVMTQLERCPQWGPHRSGGRQMEGRWARRAGTEAAPRRTSRSQQCRVAAAVSASLALLSGSLECHPLVTEPGAGC